jgi:hypothetical protein
MNQTIFTMNVRKRVKATKLKMITKSETIINGLRPARSIKLNVANRNVYSTTPVDKMAYCIRSSLTPAFLKIPTSKSKSVSEKRMQHIFKKTQKLKSRHYTY